MRRYTGQKSLYEAINRSRVKVRRGRILERLLLDTLKREKPAAREKPVQAQPTQASPETSPAPQEPVRPVLEKLREAVIARQKAKLPPSASAGREVTPTPKPAPAATKPRLVRKTERTEPAPAAAQPRPVERTEHPESVPAGAQTPPVEKEDHPGPATAAVPMWGRLRPVQLNAGRIEISVPYHIGIVAALSLILVTLVAFRVGQKFSGARALAPVATQVPVRTARQNAAAEAGTAQPASGGSGQASAGGAAVRREGDHWIVLAQHKSQEDLAPVVDYFAKQGIELSIYELGSTRKWFQDHGVDTANLPGGQGYLLATRHLYSNPNRPGTDGYDIKQKIVELGKSYEAPPGRETFAATHFSDAYGMKISSLAK
jgi:hypothetical protein